MKRPEYYEKMLNILYKRDVNIKSKIKDYNRNNWCLNEEKNKLNNEIKSLRSTLRRVDKALKSINKERILGIIITILPLVINNLMGLLGYLFTDISFVMPMSHVLFALNVAAFLITPVSAFCGFISYSNSKKIIKENNLEEIQVQLNEKNSKINTIDSKVEFNKQRIQELLDQLSELEIAINMLKNQLKIKISNVETHKFEKSYERHTQKKKTKDF